MDLTQWTQSEFWGFAKNCIHKGMFISCDTYLGFSHPPGQPKNFLPHIALDFTVIKALLSKSPLIFRFSSLGEVI